MNIGFNSTHLNNVSTYYVKKRDKIVESNGRENSFCAEE